MRKKKNVSFLVGIATGVAMTGIILSLVAASSPEDVSPVKARERTNSIRV